MYVLSVSRVYVMYVLRAIRVYVRHVYIGSVASGRELILVYRIIKFYDANTHVFRC